MAIRPALSVMGMIELELVSTTPQPAMTGPYASSTSEDAPVKTKTTQLPAKRVIPSTHQFLLDISIFFTMWAPEKRQRVPRACDECKRKKKQVSPHVRALIIPSIRTLHSFPTRSISLVVQIQTNILTNMILTACSSSAVYWNKPLYNVHQQIVDVHLFQCCSLKRHPACYC